MQLKITLVSNGAAEKDGVNVGFLSHTHKRTHAQICILNIGSTGVQNGNTQTGSNLLYIISVWPQDFQTSGW